MAISSYYNYNASTGRYVYQAQTSTATREIIVTGIPTGALVTRAVLTLYVAGTGTTPLNYQRCEVNGETLVGSSSDEGALNSVRMIVRTNRTVTLNFVYQTRNGTQNGVHGFTATFKGITLTITYQDVDAEYVDEEPLIPVETVMLYDGKTTDFSANGIMLHPISCSVTEEAAGEYELQMEHPRDPEGRWQGLVEEAIIKAGVPPYKIPAVQIPVGKVWRAKTTVTETPLYSQLPYYTRAQTGVDNTDTMAVWNASTRYSEGTLVVYPSKTSGAYIFRASSLPGNVGQNPSSSTGYWSLVADYKPSSTSQTAQQGTYNPGKVVRWLVAEEIVTFVATYDWKYIQVRDNLGHLGYVIKADFEETTTAPEPYTVPARTIYTQLFRIYNVSCDEVAGTITVSARHISYDLQGNALFDCKLIEAEPATAVALMQGRLMHDDSRLIACPFDYPLITADWSFGNPVQALLDPDDGLAAQLQARVLRDNADFFILPNLESRRGVRLAYGVNLTGVTWERDVDELVTRIIPRAGDGEDGYIYLDELFVDSQYINDYSVVHIEVLDSEYSVGEEIEKPDGTKRTLTRSEVIERMRQEAEDRFYVDGADSVAVSLDVEFVLLGDTEEYQQYRNLQRVNLYDKITIDTGSMDTTAQVIGYDWDCLNGRYNGISIGKVFTQARKRIPGYRVAKGTIGYSKLAPGLIKWIRGAT